MRCFKGYMTIEAALIVPFIFLLSVSLVLMTLFFYDHILIKNESGEMALRILNEGNKEMIMDEYKSKLEKELVLTSDVSIHCSETEDLGGIIRGCQVNIKGNVNSSILMFGSIFQKHNVNSYLKIMDRCKINYVKGGAES